MPDISALTKAPFDRTKVILGAFVFFFSFVIYALTVQPSISFWDCGEFVACSAILGIPHPPGTPLFVLLGRVFAVLPTAADISLRVNYLSVLSSAFTALFSFLFITQVAKYFFADPAARLSRIITFAGAVAGAFFVAFSETNWGNSVEAEVYGVSLALMVSMMWLTAIYFENRGTAKATRIKILVMYLAMLGIGFHMTVFLVMPVVAIFFMLNNQATVRDWLIVCGFIVLELIMIMLFSDGRGGAGIFYMFSGVLAITLLILLYRKINWAIAIAIASVSSIILGFDEFFTVAPLGILALIVLAVLSKGRKWNLEWKTGLAILVIAIIGFSVHLYLPIRSAEHPRINENNPSRDFRTFVNYLDRKQYGEISMIERMFKRRGQWANQFGRHPNMGYWSYFETQYSSGGIVFVVFFLTPGLIGMYLLARRRPEIGMPFIVLVLLCSVGLILYMNFADGTKYSFETGDAYQEVRNRDYFFTPAFVFFGIAMGLGIAAILQLLREFVAQKSPGMESRVVYAGTLLVLMPSFALAGNYNINDRSNNFLPRAYAQNLLDSCDKDAILFTSGDNDTFPVWCLQEAYGYRQDVRVVNLSLLQTDWYVHQMKHQYNVPISLSDEQILWYPFETEGGQSRPNKPFFDRPRNRQTYMVPSMHNNRIVRVSEMMTDEIIIENRWRVPIYFSAPPYAESPLGLRERAVLTGEVYRLEREPQLSDINVEKSYDLYMNTYKFTGLENSAVYRDENAAGVFINLGMSAMRLSDALMAQNDTTRSAQVLEKMIVSYPEYFQTYYARADQFDRQGDSVKATELYHRAVDTLTAFHKAMPENPFYLQDMGYTTYLLGQRLNDPTMKTAGIGYIWDAFNEDSNSAIAFRKLVATLSQEGQFTEMQRAAKQLANYKVNLNDQLVQRILGISPPSGMTSPFE